MENTNLNEIIELTKDSPSKLEKLSEDFINIENHFNIITSNLYSEKQSIENNSDNIFNFIKNDYNQKNNELIKEKENIENTTINSLNFIKNQHRQQIIDEETELKNGTFIPAILKKQIDTFSENKTMYTIFKWCSLVIGVFVLFKVQWFIGILIGVLGLWIFNSLAEGVLRKINSLNSFF